MHAKKIQKISAALLLQMVNTETLNVELRHNLGGVIVQMARKNTKMWV